MTEVLVRKEGRAGRITLNRPRALNALTHEMCLRIEETLIDWWQDEQVSVVILDGVGDKAFCAGGDIAKLYASGQARDFDYGGRFWRDEYRLNAMMAEYEKPIVSFLNGFTMGGGVGIGCHVAHRIVGESSEISMPECGIGLVPDVGGTLLLSRAPGRLGVFAGLTGARLDAGDAIYMGFADHFVCEDDWAELKTELIETGDTMVIAEAVKRPPDSALAADQAYIDALFEGTTLAEILTALTSEQSEFTTKAAQKVLDNSALAMACTLAILSRLDAESTIVDALDLEYRCTSRAMEHGDFLEGIRAQIIDRDRNPKWRWTIENLPDDAVAKMLADAGRLNDQKVEEFA